MELYKIKERRGEKKYQYNDDEVLGQGEADQRLCRQRFLIHPSLGIYREVRFWFLSLNALHFLISKCHHLQTQASPVSRVRQLW